MKIRSISLSLLFAFAASPWAAEEFQQQAAHVHGEARLDLVFDQGELVAELESPAESLVGFERQPGNDAERQRLSDARKALEEGGRMLGLPKAAGCRQQAFEIASALLDDGRAEAVADQTGGEGGHADFDLSWKFRCEHPESLTGITPGIFASFPGLQRLHVQALGPWGQKGGDLSPKNALFGF